jgi:RNA recognition motif-containing protein
MINIYVGNLPYSVRDEQLRDMFTEFGTVASAKVVMDRETNRSKGFGFVEMEDKSAAEAAIEAMNNKDMGGRPLRVNEARPRESSPRGGGGGGFRRG